MSNNYLQNTIHHVDVTPNPTTTTNEQSETISKKQHFQESVKVIHLIEKSIYRKDFYFILSKTPDHFVTYTVRIILNGQWGQSNVKFTLFTGSSFWLMQVTFLHSRKIQFMYVLFFWIGWDVIILRFDADFTVSSRHRAVVFSGRQNDTIPFTKLARCKKIRVSFYIDTHLRCINQFVVIHHALNRNKHQ